MSLAPCVRRSGPFVRRQGRKVRRFTSEAKLRMLLKKLPVKNRAWSYWKQHGERLKTLPPRAKFALRRMAARRPSW